MIRGSTFGFIKGLYYESRFADPEVKIRCEPRTRLSFGKDARVRGKGLLRFGVTWANESRLSSSLTLSDTAIFEIDGKVEVYEGSAVSINAGATLIIGSGYINLGSTIDVFSRISIGHNCAISKGVTIRDSDNHQIDERPMSAPISIGDNVWIGTNSTVLKGVTIGAGSVIAAGAVVTRDVPANTLVGGVPARILKGGITWK